ncbi:MAG: sugar phosphate nucleotidyltransferase [Verrucomicrobiia bacterium]
MSSPISLLVMAAGMGSRFGGLKQMEPVGPSGETLLDYSIFDAIRAGFDRIVFLIRKDFEPEFKQRVGQRFHGKIDVAYAFQALDDLPPPHRPPNDRTKPWGTTHAIWCARNTISGPFGAVNADDFYGRDAFAQLATFLKNRPTTTPRPLHAMIGYRLDTTLSDHGTVARGVCRLRPDGFLAAVEEMLKIERVGDRILNRQDGQPETPIDGSSCASMNCWGFGPDIFPALETSLLDFLSTHSADLKAECLIPTTVNHLVASSTIDLQVIPTTASWFGMTYKEDVPLVKASIAQLVAQGEYPSALA